MEISFTWKTDTLSPMIERLRNLRREARFLRAVERAATAIEKTAKRLCVTNQLVGKGGHMQNSITHTPAEVVGDGVQVRVGVPGGPDGHPYAPFVEFGTGLFDPDGPHRIYPKVKKALAWESGQATVRVQPLGGALRIRVNPKTGKVTYRIPKKVRMVFHQMTIMKSTKGMPAKPFLGPAVKQEGPRWAENVMKALIKLAKGTEG